MVVQQLWWIMGQVVAVDSSQPINLLAHILQQFANSAPDLLSALGHTLLGLGETGVGPFREEDGELGLEGGDEFGEFVLPFLEALCELVGVGGSLDETGLEEGAHLLVALLREGVELGREGFDHLLHHLRHSCVHVDKYQYWPLQQYSALFQLCWILYGETTGSCSRVAFLLFGCLYYQIMNWLSRGISFIRTTVRPQGFRIVLLKRTIIKQKQPSAPSSLPCKCFPQMKPQKACLSISYNPLFSCHLLITCYPHVLIGHCSPVISLYQFRMGQCSLSDQQQNGCADIFKSQDSEDGSSTKQPSEKDRVLWEHELALPLAPYPEHSLPHPCFAQIAKDVTRTFPELPYFGQKSNLQRFEKVLQRLALYFPQVGYTQGLNFSVGFLLLSGCEEEECLRLMSKLMLHDRILAIGLYQDGFPLVQFYCEVFWQLLEKKMPRVYTMLKKSYITDDLWLFQWFISLFLYNFPLEFAKKVWDFIICKKELAIVLVALGVIKSLKKELAEVQFQDQIDFIDFVNQFKSIQFCRQFLDLKKIISFANSITKSEIDKAISQTKCTQNFYRNYFASPPSQQKDTWSALLKRLESQRTSYAHNSESIKYQRIDVFDNFQKIILTKYKLYQSSELRGSNFYKRSNISTPLSLKSASQKYGLAGDFNKTKHF